MKAAGAFAKVPLDNSRPRCYGRIFFVIACFLAAAIQAATPSQQAHAQSESTAPVSGDVRTAPIASEPASTPEATPSATVSPSPRAAAPAASGPSALEHSAPSSPLAASASPTPGESAAAIGSENSGAPEGYSGSGSTLLLPPVNEASMGASPSVMQSTPMAERSPSVAPSPAESPAGSDITKYEEEQQGVGSLKEFVAEGEISSPLGIEMREARRKLESGEEADGLLVVGVVPHSPADEAGIKPFRRTGHAVLSGAAVAAAMVFPPAFLALPILDYAQVGESYDMIIGVDGTRVTNFLDFEDRMRNVQPGETVYLNIARNGKRVQVPVAIPATAPASY